LSRSQIENNALDVSHIMEWQFWGSIFFIFYAYLGYPVALWLYSAINKKNNLNYSAGEFQPKVSLLISAYNEEGAIEEKVRNSLELNYPRDLLEIVVISDGSDDNTNKIVESYEADNVVLRYYEGRIGKTACLNRTVPLSSGDIIVFSDANSLYDKSSIIELVKNFQNEKVGFVTGHTKYSLAEGSEVLKSIGLYSMIEKITKILESKIGSCVGADGAIFAIRKKLYDALNDYDINDFVIPLNVIKKGYRGILEEKAFCIEGAAKDSSGEFNRQARITNRTIRALFNNLTMFNAMKYGIFSFELISHKLIKYLVPLFLVTIFVANLFLIGEGSFYILSLLAQIVFYFLSLFAFEYSGKYLKYIARIVALARTFTTVNMAIVLGWIQYFSGKTYTTWTTSR